ncbi:uncharacterized protein LOC118471824 [Amphiprion ocellaris]|uniref:uncharacterized protein LOC129348091 n=1 Tax=Amphiprion ocellaris TaxID=80972 RepID=UPI002410F5D9|nr:uncharacterized protein LOC129348091 [Amphiprion ocellaris]XP_054863484.1 uncharacterized protein LOC118471824 [Amphiprion ocellaris]
MRLKSRLCFLVLVISSVSRGENQTTVSPPGGDEKAENEASSTPTVPQSLNDTRHDANSSTATNQSPALVETVSTPVVGTPGNETTTEGSSQSSASVHVTTVSMTTDLTSPEATTPSEEEDGNTSWGYVFLVMIVLVIIVLCVILYFLRRASRTYSFDLHRPGPVDHPNLPIGTFEPVYLDDLERPTPKENTMTEEAPPAANGTSLTEEKSSSGHNAAQEHLDVNGLETSPTSNTSESPDADPVQPLDSPSLMFGDAEEQQNENNNNPSVCSNEPFVEINLDEPAWCDQLLTSPQPPSSVLLFSPFSFSSSSS